MTTVVVCGMPAEKSILTGALNPGTLILSGTDKLNLPKLAGKKCTRLVSMGLCGGLSPDLKVGAVALATAVVDKQGTWSNCDLDWNVRATALAGRAGIQLHAVPYYSSGLFDEADESPQRAALLAKYGAHAIDDETRYVAAEAFRRGIPFNVVRPLSDAFDDNLPLLARGKVMNADGSPNAGYLASALGQDQGENAESIFTVIAHYDTSKKVLESLAKALAFVIAGD